MFANHNNYLFVNDLSTNLAFDLLKFCAVERSDVTLYISLENPNFRCDELATIPMNALENIVFTSFNDNMEILEEQLMDIHNLRRKPHIIIFNASSKCFPSIFFIVSTIFSYTNFLPENAKSIVIINNLDCDPATLKKLRDLYYTETQVLNNFENLKQKLSNA